MILILFTNSYPYDNAGEQTFLAGEVKILHKYFERIILVPQTGSGDLLPLSEGVEVNLEFSKYFTVVKRFFSIMPAFFSSTTYQDIKERLPDSLSLTYLKKLFFFISGSRLTKKWLERWLIREGISASTVICYTYWFTEIAMGLGLAKVRQPELRIVSRVHGYDLYEEFYKPWPFRSLAISLLDGLYADSDRGTNYLLEKYPQFKDKYKTALLGVPDPGGVSKPSEDGVLRIVSCSMINPVKRLDLLFQGILVAAQMKKDQRIEWTHFGDGADRQRYIDRVAREFPSNVRGYFPGYQTQRNLIQTYLETPSDVFINVSSTEGTPVSIMEAISCGIPVIATAVGGNVEIVQERNGFVLSENPSVEEIAQTLLKICDQHETLLQKRQGSLDVWFERYNEAKNFEAFSCRLVEIRKS